MVLMLLPLLLAMLGLATGELGFYGDRVDPWDTRFLLKIIGSARATPLPLFVSVCFCVDVDNVFGLVSLSLDCR